jgi:putative DNA primase/helicase
LAALNKAFLWATYLEAHARRIYSAVLRPDMAAARELAKHLQKGDLPNRFTLRETYRKGWAGLSDKEDAEAATEILCDLGWIRAVAENGRTFGRPASPIFETNPKILDSPNANCQN